jgi:hypothetical protein
MALNQKVFLVTIIDGRLIPQIHEEGSGRNPEKEAQERIGMIVLVSQDNLTGMSMMVKEIELAGMKMGSTYHLKRRMGIKARLEVEAAQKHQFQYLFLPLIPQYLLF